MAYVQMVCTRETFTPRPSDGARWWEVEDYDAARDAHEGMWPGVTFWSEEEWRQFHAEGCRHADLLVDGHAVSTAGLWPRTDEEWGPIAVSTAPDHRNKGYCKALISFVTQAVLDAGKRAVIVTRDDNAPMRRVAEALGYRLRPGSWLMKVRDLIVALERLDPDLEVMCYTEDGQCLPEGMECVFLDIAAVSVGSSDWTGWDERLPSPAPGAKPRKIAVLHVTSDF
jgi:RimJ/RimL family protein N-acetyltransferase